MSELTKEKEDNDMTKTIDKDKTKNIELKDTKNITEDLKKYEELIKENIDYKYYREHNRENIEMVDGLIQIMLDVILTETPPFIRIGKETKSREIVKSVYLKLNSSHIEHIISQYKSQNHKITNKTAYLQKMLYTTYIEIDAHYINAVRSDGVVS